MVTVILGVLMFSVVVLSLVCLLMVAKAKLVVALKQIIAWYDIDDERVENTDEIFEQAHAVLKEVADAST